MVVVILHRYFQSSQSLSQKSWLPFYRWGNWCSELATTCPGWQHNFLRSGLCDLEVYSGCPKLFVTWGLPWWDIVSDLPSNHPWRGENQQVAVLMLSTQPSPRPSGWTEDFLPHKENEDEGGVGICLSISHLPSNTSFWQKDHTHMLGLTPSHLSLPQLLLQRKNSTRKSKHFAFWEFEEFFRHVL